MDVTSSTHGPPDQPRHGGATRIVAQWASDVEAHGLTPEVRHHARRLLIDYLAAAVAGSITALSRDLRRHLDLVEPGDQSTVIGGTRLGAGAAAFANGTAAHGLELDDGYTPGAVHPSVTALPAILAAAEFYRSEPHDVTTAIAVGVETTCRIAAAGHPATLNAGFHNTAVAGVFGAAAGVANLLGADASRMASALGIAGSHAGGLHEYSAEGSEVKRLHAGKSARAGLASAQLGVAGMPGPHTVLEGANGYFAAFARGDWRPDLLVGDLGERWTFLGTYVKTHPCCRHLHGPIDAALALFADGDLDTTRIERIEVDTFAIAARFNRPRPRSFMEAQFSIPHAVAVALRVGRVGVEAFGDDLRADAEVQRMAEVTAVRTDPTLDGRYPHERPAVVTLHLIDGSVQKQSVSQPIGEPDNPISDDHLGQKFMRMVVPVLGHSRAERTLAAAWDLTDLAPITTDLGATGQQSF